MPQRRQKPRAPSQSRPVPEQLLPASHFSPLSARAYAQAIPTILEQTSALIRKGMAENGETQVDLTRAAVADGIHATEPRIARLRHLAKPTRSRSQYHPGQLIARQDVDLFLTEYALRRYGYSLADSYSGAGSHEPELSAEEQELLLAYRALSPLGQQAVTHVTQVQLRGEQAMMARAGNVVDLHTASGTPPSARELLAEAQVVEALAQEALGQLDTAAEAHRQHTQEQHTKKGQRSS